MIETLIRAAYRRRWLVLALALLIVALGVVAFRRQKVEAYPDISGQVVQIITTYPGRATEEVERQVTVPVELAMANVPRVEIIRSRTIFGLSVVQLSFEEGTESYWARMRVQEKLNALNLPNGANAQLGPLATAYGEVCRYELRSDASHDLMGLRELNDWVVIPRLLRTPGIADVTNFGGDAKVFAITLDPHQLQRYDLTLADVVNAIKSNNSTAGGSVLRRGSESLVIRGKGALTGIYDIGAIFLKSVGGTPIYVRDVARVDLGSKTHTGLFSKDDRDNSVEGIVLMRRGENPSEVLDKVKEAIKDLNAHGLPEGVRIDTFYDRTQLIENTFDTVAHSVLMGIGLVVVVLLLFLGSPRLAGLVALTIPFSLLFALVLMYLVDIPIGLLSVGAIDFGIIVDGAVIMAENIAHRLGARRGRTSHQAVRRTVLAAALEVERPVFFSVLMIIGVFVPLLTLTRIEGLLFRPMALTIVFALIGSLLFSLFVVPALATLLFPHGYPEWENPLLRWFRPVYARMLRFLLWARWVVAACVVTILFAVAWWISPRLGTEFLPYMDEGVIWVRANFPEGTSLQQTAAFGKRIREIIRNEFPDISFIMVQSGRNDSGTDPFPPSRMEMMLGPKPRNEWTKFANKQELVNALRQRLHDEFPTTRFNFTQPIIDSVTEDTNGTSANMAVEFSGPDPTVLQELGHQTIELLRQVRGAVDVAIEQEGPQPQLVIEPDRRLCARYNVRIEDVNTLINTALGGEPVANLYEGERVFDIVARFDRTLVTSPEAVRRLPVNTPDGVPVPLGQVAKVTVSDGQTLIAREGGRRRLTVRCDIVGRDQGGFVEEAQHRFDEAIQVPEGYRVAWLGMFENLARARRHFLIVIPVTVGLIFGLLVVTLGSIRAALVVLLAVPFAFVGGVGALYLRGMNLNVSGGVGFAALFGVAIMDGVLMVRWITTLRQQGEPMEQAIEQGALERLRPVLMTSIVAILGLLPASLATGLGSDVQRPLATVIVWGLFSSTVLTLFFVPVGYRLLAPPVPQPARAVSGEEARFIEPLPDVSTTDVVTVVEHLNTQEGEQEIYRLTDALSWDFGRVIAVVKAAEMLGFVETPGERVVLSDRGRELAAGTPEARRAVWREQLLTLRLFRDVHEALQQQPEHVLDRDFVLELIVMRMPYENYEHTFTTLVRWARFGQLFVYDESAQRLSLPG
jgi:cobalt-zinc-cadmium resistance protein CzcA